MTISFIAFSFFLQSTSAGLSTSFSVSAVLEPFGASFCSSSFLFLVHSAPGNFLQRQTLRSTWGSATSDKIIFVMGQSPPIKVHHKQKSLRSPKMDDAWTTDMSELLGKEAALHQDILQGDFVDHPLNDTLKHFLALDWTNRHCLNTSSALIVKMEDDVFVEIFHLHQFVQAVYSGSNPLSPHSFICDVIQQPDLYDHCNGAAFIMTPDLIQPLLEASHQHFRKVPEDDVFITGYLRQSLGIDSPRFLNPRYTYDQTSIQKWLKNPNGLPLPWIFVGGVRNAQLMRRLWKKTLLVHGQNDSGLQD